MNKEYSILLENLLARRYDEALRESIVSDSFEESEYSDCLKYTLESMQEIDPSYSYKTFHIAKRIQERVARFLAKEKIRVDFRYQGSIQTETHVVLHGGVELLVLQEVADKTPWKHVFNLSQLLMDLFTREGGFKEISQAGRTKINLTTLKPSCEITIMPAIWLNNPGFRESKREIDRGICEYNLVQKTQRKYLPFLNIARINSRDTRSKGGLKKMARLLRTLQRDASSPIALSNYEICSLLYRIPEKQLIYKPNHPLALIGVVSAQLNRVVSDKAYREGLVSPSNKELVFGKKPNKLEPLQLLKSEMDELIQDLHQDLRPHGKNLYSEIAY